MVFNEGEPGDSLYIVLAGKIKLGRRAADGRQNLIAVMGPSDMVGELSLFDPGPRTATATAVTDARLARMRKQALRPWMTNRPEIAEQLLRVLARRLRRTNDALADLIFTDVPGRVAKNLLQMAGRFGTPRRRRPAGHPRPHPGGAGPAGRRLPGDGEQGAGRLRLPRLAAAGRQDGHHPRPGAARPPRPLSATARPRLRRPGRG